MLLLLTKALPAVQRLGRADVGRLLTPRHYPRAADTGRAGIAWAADNDAFSGFHEPRYRAMLAAIEGAPGCRFVTAPDVVGDAPATLELFARWSPILRGHGLPAAIVGQDGMRAEQVPWDAVAALFVGGSTEWKLGADARALVAAARQRGRWVHMGRVNSLRRVLYAREIGCHSVDGSGYSRWTDRWVPAHLDALARGEQTRLAC